MSANIYDQLIDSARSIPGSPTLVGWMRASEQNRAAVRAAIFDDPSGLGGLDAWFGPWRAMVREHQAWLLAGRERARINGQWAECLPASHPLGRA